MIERYAVVASRIRQDLKDIERVVDRTQRAVAASRQRPEDLEFYLDSAALNLHDFYAGLERVFEYIAANVDRSVPSGHDWHRELLRQMAVDIPQIRPQVLSMASSGAIDEYLRFRHVVRNIYAFEFDPERIGRLVRNLSSSFEQVKADLLSFAEFMDKLVQTE